MGSTEQSAAWRANRAPGWTKDIGYALQTIVRSHRYEVRLPGAKPEDPGWHPCSCGWEGYWSAFEPHVADELRALVAERFEL
jgi:hypothetical protein